MSTTRSSPRTPLAGGASSMGSRSPREPLPRRRLSRRRSRLGISLSRRRAWRGLQGTDGILAEKGASGVLICGGGDIRRGRVAAELLMEACKLNGGLWGAFVDYPGLLDRCRASPLYGEASRAAIIAEYKGKNILTLHVIDVAITDRYGGEVLGEIVRSRNARRQTTILTARMSWQELERQASGKRGTGGVPGGLHRPPGDERAQCPDTGLDKERTTTVDKVTGLSIQLLISDEVAKTLPSLEAAAGDQGPMVLWRLVSIVCN